MCKKFEKGFYNKVLYLTLIPTGSYTGRRPTLFDLFLLKTELIIQSLISKFDNLNLSLARMSAGGGY